MSVVRHQVQLTTDREQHIICTQNVLADKKSRGARLNAPYTVPNGPQPLLVGAICCSVNSDSSGSSTATIAIWLPGQDSNLDRRIQSP